MDRNCTACNINIDKHSYKNDRTVCKKCYNKMEIKRNNIISEKDEKDLLSTNKQIKDNRATVSASEKHRHVIIGTNNVGKTY